MANGLFKGTNSSTSLIIPQSKARIFFSWFFPLLLFFLVCVRRQHRSNSSTSSLCWPSSAPDREGFSRDRPHPLPPHWVLQSHSQGHILLYRGGHIHKHVDIGSIWLIVGTLLILESSSADKATIDVVTAILQCILYSIGWVKSPTVTWILLYYWQTFSFRFLN